MEDDDLLGVMLDFGVRCSRSCRCAAAQRLPGGARAAINVPVSPSCTQDDGENTVAPSAAAALPPLAAGVPPGARERRLAADATKHPAAALATLCAADATHSCTLRPTPAHRLPRHAGLPPGVPQPLPAASPTPAASTASASSAPSVGGQAPQALPPTLAYTHQEFLGYRSMASLLARKHRDKIPAIQAMDNKAKAFLNVVGAAALALRPVDPCGATALLRCRAHMSGAAGSWELHVCGLPTTGSAPCTPTPQPNLPQLERFRAATMCLRNELKQAFTPEDYEWAKQQCRTRMPGAAASPVQPAAGAPPQHPALMQQQQQRQAAPAGMHPQQAQQQAAQQAQQRAASRGPSPVPAAPSPAPAAASAAPGGQLTAQQVLQAQQQQILIHQAMAAQAAAAAAAAAKRPAGGCCPWCSLKRFKVRRFAADLACRASKPLRCRNAYRRPSPAAVLQAADASPAPRVLLVLRLPAQ